MPIRILIVEDNHDIRKAYIKELLRNLKHTKWYQTFPEDLSNPDVEIDDTATVENAFEKLRSHQFDILIVDLKIPGVSENEMGGLEVISESIRLNPLRLIIVITGYGTVELAKITLSQGVFDFIEKSARLPATLNKLVNSVSRALDYRKEKIIRSGNPFSRMTGVEPMVFGGRKNELDFFDQKLKRVIHTKFRDHFLVLGDWGIGKSTLLKEYKKICQSNGYVCAIVPLEPLQAGTTIFEAVRSIIEGILRDLPYSPSRFRKLIEYFHSIGITILGTGLKISRDLSKSELSPQAFLHDSLITLWNDLKSITDVLVILLDDLDNFLPVSEVVMTIKQTFSMEKLSRNNILVGITSTPLAWNNIILLSKHHPLSRYFISRVHLQLLAKEELYDTVLKSFINSGVSIDNEIISKIYDYTNGHPFEMQVLCYNLYNNQLNGRVEIDLWDQALQASIIDMGLAYFEYRFSHASSGEAKILRLISEIEDPIAIDKVKELIQSSTITISLGSITNYLTKLAAKNLIIRVGRGLYSIPDKMFRTYIQSYIEKL
ncbi:MAG: response regulator [Desulfobaccales bacterium]